MTPLLGTEPYVLLTDIIQDNFLTQLVDKPTQERTMKIILDLVLTTNGDIIENLHVGDIFSNHNTITFTLTSTSYNYRRSEKKILCLQEGRLGTSKVLTASNSMGLCSLVWRYKSKLDRVERLIFTAVDECIPKSNKAKKDQMHRGSQRNYYNCRKRKGW